MYPCLQLLYWVPVGHRKLLLVDGRSQLYPPIAFNQGGTKSSPFTSRKDQFFGAIHAPELPRGIRRRPNTKLQPHSSFQPSPAYFILFLLRAHLNASYSLESCLRLCFQLKTAPLPSVGRVLSNPNDFVKIVMMINAP